MQPLPSAGKHVTGVTRGKNEQHVFPRLAQVGSCNNFHARENMLSVSHAGKNAQYVFPRLSPVANVFDWSTALFAFAVM